jgi:hypothetical protein
MFDEHFPGTRDASPTAPRAEGGVDWGYALGRTYLLVNGVTVAVEGYPCHDATLGIGVWTSEAIKSVAEGKPHHSPKPPCATCGKSEYAHIWRDEGSGACRVYRPKEPAPCESGNECDVGGEATMARHSTNLDKTNGASSSSVSGAVTATAASDPATVAGEGPYRVCGPWINRGGRSEYYGGDPESTKNWCAALNHAHRTALAVRETEVNELKTLLLKAENLARYYRTMYETRHLRP